MNSGVKTHHNLCFANSVEIYIFCLKHTIACPSPYSSQHSLSDNTQQSLFCAVCRKRKILWSMLLGNKITRTKQPGIPHSSLIIPISWDPIFKKVNGKVATALQILSYELSSIK